MSWSNWSRPTTGRGLSNGVWLMAKVVQLTRSPPPPPQKVEKRWEHPDPGGGHIGQKCTSWQSASQATATPSCPQSPKCTKNTRNNAVRQRIVSTDGSLRSNSIPNRRKHMRPPKGAPPRLTARNTIKSKCFY